jgi:hypothetical protein
VALLCGVRWLAYYLLWRCCGVELVACGVCRPNGRTARLGCALCDVTRAVVRLQENERWSDRELELKSIESILIILYTTP